MNKKYLKSIITLVFASFIIGAGSSSLAYTQSVGPEVTNIFYKYITIHFFPTVENCRPERAAAILGELKSMDSSQGFHFLVDECGHLYQGDKIDHMVNHGGYFLSKFQDERKNLSQNNISIMLPLSMSRPAKVEQLANTVLLIDEFIQKYPIVQIYNSKSLYELAGFCGVTFVASPGQRVALSSSQESALTEIFQFFPHLQDNQSSICIN